MSRFKKQIFLLTLLCIVNNSESELGRTCRNSRSCGYSVTLVEEEFCVDGICRCNPDYEVQYSSVLNPRCENIFLSLNMFVKGCKEKKCGENEYCMERPSPFTGINSKQIKCMCNPGFLRINSACREASHQKVLERCYIPENGTVKSCDVNGNSFCKDGICVCFESYFANVTSGKCEPKGYYMKAHNLDEYRVRPHEYCLKESDCISGLECSNYQCECPQPCKYNETAEICDCGVIEKPPAPGITWPVIVGVLLGLCIVAFWYRTIKKMIKKYAKKKNASHNEVTATEETRPTYALQPMSPRHESAGNATSRELTYPVASPEKRSGELTYPVDIPEKRSLLPAGTNSEGNAYIPPPQPSQYGFSTPYVSSALPPVSPGAPPPYSLLPSAADSPPPYSLNPQEGSFNASIPDFSTPSSLPYPCNAATPIPAVVGPANPTGSYGMTAPALNPSTALPYPYNPTTPNPDAYGSANPTGSDSPTAPVLNPSTVLPYPLSPTISGPMSATPSVPSAPPYALGSNSASAPKQD
ncbi:uncharacterized protein [Palaemon carinicauda]|uniref:uncharacterized protein isoform X1 n=1 Tax=Palaemon carinicauda TaxID=392227 RepID=UPI0035B65DC2